MFKYDLIMIVGSFKRVTQYLNIIKGLSGSYKVGILPLPLSEESREKHNSTNIQFVQKCMELGAEVIDFNQKVTVKFALFPQEDLELAALKHVKKNVVFKDAAILMAFAWGGKFIDKLEDFSVKKLFVVDRRFFNFVLPHRGKENIKDDHKIYEVGLPFDQYRVFEELSADYILAIPTPWSFPHERDKHLFLNSVISVFSQLASSVRIVYKKHNATDYDYLSSCTYRTIASALPNYSSKVIGKIVNLFAKLNIGTNGPIEKLFTALLYKKVIQRCLELSQITPYSEFALEAYLPGIRKGVIGGNSNTMWGALFFKLPFYNCSDRSVQDRMAKDRINNKWHGGRALVLNLEYFDVPFCGGELKFDEKGWDIISSQTRSADLISVIASEIEAL